MSSFPETGIHDPRTGFRLTSSSNSLMTFDLCCFGDPRTLACGLSVAGVTFSERADGSLLCWILVGSEA